VKFYQGLIFCQLLCYKVHTLIIVGATVKRNQCPDEAY